MPSKARLKYIKSLQVKKYRSEEQSFVVEGATSVLELLNSDFEIVLVAATYAFLAAHGGRWRNRRIEIIECSDRELSSMGSLHTNDAALAVARMKPNRLPSAEKDEMRLVLDDIRDPGNLGTIIRTADWYGIRSIVASDETADVYNPKVISATMGSFCRVTIHYTSLLEYLPTVSRVYGTFLDGNDVHGVTFEPGAIVIGNESGGISPAVARLVHERITIPSYGSAESLNAGIATAIVLDNFRRSQK